MKTRGALLWLVLGSIAGCGSSFMPRAADPGAEGGTTGASVPAAAGHGFESPGGMWLPSQLGLHGATLRELGFDGDVAKLADPTGSPLGAIVWLGGCTGSLVSPEGLVITNHHCVTRYLQQNSTEQNNLLRDGFVARARSAEKWVGPAGRIYVTRSIRDVTAQVQGGIESIGDPRKRHEAIESRTKQVIASCEKDRPELRCRVASAFGGGQWWLMEQLELRDLRLVYAPADGVGNFGGEIDNWRWPRHSGDVAILRVYVDQDGKPADHSAKNVPFRPTRYLRLAKQPLEPGDLVFVTGFPGVTKRWHTAAEVRHAVEWEYPQTLSLCDELIALIERLGGNDGALAIKGEGLLRGLGNWRTNTRGMLDGLVKGGLETRKLRLETELAEWIASQPARVQKYGSVIDRLAGAHVAYRANRGHDAALDDVVWLSTLLGAADQIVHLAQERAKPDGERDPRFQQRNWKPMVERQRAKQLTYDRRLELALLTQLLVRAARLPEQRRPAIVQWVVGPKPPTSENIRAALEKMVDKTQLEDVEVRVRLLQKASARELKGLRDPFIRLALKLRPVLQQIEDRHDLYVGTTALDRPRYVDALREKAGGVLAPDANSTLRVTFGTVRGYRPAAGREPYHPFTYLPEVVAKHTGKRPFLAPAALLAAAKRPAGPYVDSRRGQVPVNFLADLDITGGNSGSPTLNARGELCGLVFDGNYESMASDWLFMPAITRSIHVDLRYILWLLDEVAGADHLLRELAVKPAPGR